MGHGTRRCGSEAPCQRRPARRRRGKKGTAPPGAGPDGAGWINVNLQIGGADHAGLWRYSAVNAETETGTAVALPAYQVENPVTPGTVTVFPDGVTV